MTLMTSFKIAQLCLIRSSRVLSKNMRKRPSGIGSFFLKQFTEVLVTTDDAKSKWSSADGGGVCVTEAAVEKGHTADKTLHLFLAVDQERVIL